MNREVIRNMEILLVEDNRVDAKVTIEVLRQDHLRCRVTLVCDGDEASRFLSRNGEFARAPTPDPILLDMLLPKKDGRQVLAEIRSDEELKRIPVLVLTGSLDHEAILQTEGLHVDGFMTIFATSPAHAGARNATSTWIGFGNRSKQSRSRRAKELRRL